MKKSFLLPLLSLALVIIFTNSNSADAAVNPNTGVKTKCMGLKGWPTKYWECVSGLKFEEPKKHNNYISWYYEDKESYRVDYEVPNGAKSYQVYSENQQSKEYDLKDDAPPTGSVYIPGGGKSQIIFYGADDEFLSRTPVIDTPKGSGSAPFYGAKNPLNVRWESGRKDSIVWEHPEDAESIDIYVDGKKIDTIHGAFWFYDLTPEQAKGQISVVAKDAAGNVLYESDMPFDGQLPDAGMDDGSGGLGLDGSSGPGNGGGGISLEDLQDCVDQICECIRSLLPVLYSIDSNTGGILSELIRQTPELQHINYQLSDLLVVSRQIRDGVYDIRDELRTNQQYPIKDVNDYRYPTLEENKPPMRDGVYKDDKVYFTDRGDAAAPPPFPAAPEPKPWKDDKGKEMKQEPMIDQDKEMQQDAPLQRSDDLERDLSLEKDDSLEKDESLKREEVLDADPVYERDKPLEQDITQYRLRWKSP